MNPRAVLAYAVALALACFGAGHLVGRHTAPARVETREVLRTVEVEKKVVEVRQAEARRVVVYRDRLVTPDGTVRESERVAEATDTRTESTATAERAATVARQAHTVTQARPDWRVGVLAVAPLLPAGRPSVGPWAERRLIGPVSLGAGVLVPTGPGTPLSVAAALTVEF